MPCGSELGDLCTGLWGIGFGGAKEQMDQVWLLSRMWSHAGAFCCSAESRVAGANVKPWADETTGQADAIIDAGRRPSPEPPGLWWRNQVTPVWPWQVLGGSVLRSPCQLFQGLWTPCPVLCRTPPKFQSFTMTCAFALAAWSS